MKVIVGLMIDQRITEPEEIRRYTNDITTYINQIDQLYIYNMTPYDLELFYEKLAKYANIQYTNCEAMGEVDQYQIVMEKAVEDNADFAVVLKMGYYYEEEVFLNLKRYLLEHDSSNIAVLTPLPLYGCMTHERKAEVCRAIKGCKLVGAWINVHLYQSSRGFKTEYYQTTFDYEYCLRQRANGYHVLVLNNEVLRDDNYKIIEKKFFFLNVSTYDKDLMDVYYEMRNRLYLWDEYAKIDPEYVKLDKKLAKLEKHEMRYRDRNYRDKFDMMEQARLDYKKGRKGIYKSQYKNE